LPEIIKTGNSTARLQVRRDVVL